MSLMPVKTAISDVYPNPDNATANAGFGALWDAMYEATEKPELDVASAATVNIGGQLSTKLRITGTTGPITSFGTTYRGPILIRYAAAVAITHNPTTLILPGGANLTTSAGGTMIVYPKATSGTADGWIVAFSSDYFAKAGANSNITSLLGLTTPISGTLIGVQVFTSSGTYTPTSGTQSVVVEVQGGGGGGGAAFATAAGQFSMGAGGHAGTYGKSRITSGFSGVTVTVGAAGTSAFGGGGTAGGTSSFGSSVTAPGGSSGLSVAAGTSAKFVLPLANTTPASGGNISNEIGGCGGVGMAFGTGLPALSGYGGASKFGGGAVGVLAFAGLNAINKGSGGSGATNNDVQAAALGGNGAAGVVIVWEYA